MDQSAQKAEVSLTAENKDGLTLSGLTLPAGVNLEKTAVQSFSNFQNDLRPLTFNQQGIWLIQTTYPDNWAYNVPFAVEISGKIEPLWVEASFKKLVANHPHLNAKIISLQGTPCLSIIKDKSVWIQYEKVPPDVCMDAVLHHAQSLSFDLDKGPLMRCHLFSISREKYLLLFVVHHLVCDGLSLFLLYKEFLSIYADQVQGQKETARSVDDICEKDPFLNFMTQSQQMLTGQQHNKMPEFWKNCFRKAPEVIDFPYDYAHKQVQTIKNRTGNTIYFPLSNKIHRRIRALGKSLDITLSPIFLAAFKILIHKYTGQTDLITCMPVAGRKNGIGDTAVGYFANTLAIRENVDGQLSANAVMMNLRQTISAALSNSDYDFPLLIRALRRMHGQQISGAFEIAFAYHNYFDRQGIALEKQCFWHHYNKVMFKPRFDIRQTGEFDLTLEVLSLCGGTSLCFKYDQELFDRQTIQQLFRHYKAVLKQILKNPSVLISRIELSSQSERHKLVHAWNDTQRPFAGNELIHQGFERRVQKAPNDIAVADGRRHMTYRELNTAANQLAHFLRTRGLAPKTPVAVIITRSLDMITSVLGIVKAGGYYIPLEPYLPDDRMVKIIQEMKISFVLTNQQMVQRVKSMAGQAVCIQTICSLDATVEAELLPGRTTPCHLHGRTAINRLPTTDPRPVNHSTDLAYVLFTSGSTGMPKGVMVQHRPVINLIEWVNHTYNVQCRDKILFITSLGFDLSVYDIFGMLSAGGTIRVVSEMDIRDPRALIDIIRHEGITFWDSAPAALQGAVPLFFEANHLGDLKIRRFFLSGDYIPVPMAEQLRMLFPKAQIISLGGATEATIWSNYYNIEKVDPAWITVPYGKPIQNARYYVLNEQLKPCPIGVPGQLYIGGECLAAGYINDSHLSLKKFTVDPFVPDGRMYHTGDLARWRQDGNLEFLGRMDTQVKINGYRIELGEIENALRECKGVAETLITVRKGYGPSKRLCGYFTSDEILEIGLLKTQLRQVLPEYMIPTFLMQVDRIPVTANGKIDRKALPAPCQLVAAEGPPPQSPTAMAMADIWKALLDLKHLPNEASNFFDLGGDSLLIARLTTQINNRFKTELSFADAFRLPVLGDLCQVLDAPPAKKKNSPAVCMKPGKKTVAPFFCIHPGGGDITCFAKLAGSLSADIPFFGLRATDHRLNPSSASGLIQMIDQYYEAILSVQPEGLFHIGGFCAGGAIAWEIAARLRATGHCVQNLILIDSLAPCDYPVWQDTLDVYFAFLRDFGELILLEAFCKRHQLSAKHQFRKYLEALTPTEFVDAVFECARTTGLLTAGFDKAFVQRNFNIFKMICKEISQLSPSFYDGAATLLKAEESFEKKHLQAALQCNRHQHDLMVKFNQSHDLGWGRFCQQPLTIKIVPGNHFSILKAPQVDRLCSFIEPVLLQPEKGVNSKAMAQPENKNRQTLYA